MLKVIIGLGLIFIIYVYVSNFNEKQINTYQNKNDALEDTAILRGWIPSIIPNSSYEIIETHDIATNEINGSFKYYEPDEIYFLNKLISKNGVYRWKDFYFKVDKEKNEVLFFSNNK